MILIRFKNAHMFSEIIAIEIEIKKIISRENKKLHGNIFKKSFKRFWNISDINFDNSNYKIKNIHETL